MKRWRPGRKVHISLLLIAAAVGIVFFLAMESASETGDPLPSWADGETRRTIENFVANVTTEGSADFVATENRIAVFDNDGTLWSERPWVEGEFKKYQITKAAEKSPLRRQTQPFKAAFENDQQYFVSGGWPVVLGPARMITAELTRNEYDTEVRDFFATESHSELNVPFRQTVYQPVMELLEYLRASGFKTYICSGGGMDFMRVISWDFYGIEPENVIGSSLIKELRNIDGRWELVSTSEVNVFNNKDQKAVNIDLHIGQRPLLVMGNAGGRGDIGMLGYSQWRDGVSLQILVNHDDAAREFAYAEDDNASLNAARENGWLIVSMKNDWSAIYPSVAQQ